MSGALKLMKPTPEQLQAADPESSVWVSANAGSGKTHVLVDRVVRLMLEGAAPESILCLTFTKAAAAEMQNRLFERLSQWTLATDKDLKAALAALGVALKPGTLTAARQLFTRALETPGGLRIQTIHALAERLLRLFPVEAGVAPGFTVLDDLERRQLLLTAQQSLFRMSERGDDPSLSATLALIAEHANEQRFSDLIAYFVGEYATLVRHLGGATGLHQIRKILAEGLGVDPSIEIEHLNDELCRIDTENYRRVTSIFMPLDPHSNYHAGERLRAVLDSANELRLGALREMAFTKERRLRKSLLSSGNQKAHAEEFQWFVAELQRIAQLFEKRDELIRLDATAALYYVAQRITAFFVQQKQNLGAFDFDDLIQRTARLLQGSSHTQWVLYKLDRGITHILVDEAQDTNAEQWAIVGALAQEFFAGRGVEQLHARTLFVVGDRKQSIYSFQGADARAYEKVRDYFAGLIRSAEQDMSQVPLTTSYRSVPEVLDAVDQVFNTQSYKDMGFLAPEERGHTSSRPNEHGAFELWPMFADDKREEPEAWGAPVDADWEGSCRRKLARAIACQVKDWIGNRMLPAKEGEPQRPVTPGDILILFRKRGGLFENTIAELRQRDIEVAGADRLTLNESLTVHDLLALGQVTILPDDDHALACVLKSPFVPHALSEDELFEIAYGRENELLMSRLAHSSNANMRANHEALSLYAKRRDDGPYAFYANILSQCREALLARLGPEALDASDAFLEYCIQFEQQRGTSLSGFLAWFENSIIELKREMDEAQGQVRLMTIHGAKGLEAPIVILADAAETHEAAGLPLIAITTEHQNHPREGLLYWNVSDLIRSTEIEQWRSMRAAHEKQERYRLLYVAMTRARDVFCIAGADRNGVANDGSLYHYVQEKVKAAPDFAHDVASPHFEEPILRHGMELARDRGTQRLMSTPPSLKPWMKQKPPKEVALGVQSLTGFVGAWQGKPERQGPSADARRGTAIHNLLEALAAVPEEQRERLAVRKQAGLGLTEHDAQNLLTILRMPELQPFLSDDARSEADVFIAPDDEVLTGRIDRMLVTDEAIWLLDYKTTRNPPAALSPHDDAVKQLALYAQGLAEVFPGREIRAALLFTETRALHWLTPQLITQVRDFLRA